MKEAWKDIKGFEGIYKISNKGNVKSLPRKRKDKNGNPTIKVNEKVLKFKICPKHGYYRVTLCKNSKQKYCSVSRLVALHFIENKSNLPEVNHIDEDKSNNSVSNLEWITRIDNVRHGTGIERSAKKRKGKKRKNYEKK